MEYIDTNKWRTKPCVSTLLFIIFSCRNIKVFGYHQVFDEVLILICFTSGLGKEYDS